MLFKRSHLEKNILVKCEDIQISFMGSQGSILFLTKFPFNKLHW